MRAERGSVQVSRAARTESAGLALVAISTEGEGFGCHLHAGTA
ncbi:hypothetical protein ACFPN7_14255 [Amycolatopsis halotolerans]